MARKGYISKTIKLPDGTRKYLYAKTKEELEEKYIEACIQLRAGVDLSNHDTFGEYTQMWYNTFKKGVVKPSTEIHYKNLLNNHIMPALAGYKMKDITPMACASVFTEMTKSGCCNSTQAAARRLMVSIFSSAVDNGVIPRSPMTRDVKAKGAVNEKRKALQDSEIKRLLEVTKGEVIEPVIILGLYTGLRIGEIYGLHWTDVDMKKREIRVRHNLHWAPAPAYISDNPKTSAGLRTIPFGDEVYDTFCILRRDAKGPLVFHGADGSPYAQHVHVKAWRCTARLGMGHALTPHILRHTAITKWLAAGMDVKEVQYLAGHSCISTTLGIYADYMAESRLESTREKMERAYGKI